MINKKALKSQMVLFGDTQESLANYIGVSRQALSHKMNGKAQFTLNEVKTIRRRYNLQMDVLASIFFTD